MMGWIIGIAFLLGYLVFWRATAYYIARDISGDDVPEGEFLVMGMLLGFLLSWFWPLVAIGLGVRRVYLWRGETVAALIVPRSVLKRVELERHEESVEMMEREMGIK